MFKAKAIRFLLSALLIGSAGVATSCATGGGGGGGGGSSKGKSDRLKWVNRPSSGSATKEMISVPGIGINFYIPDVLYVYKTCAEAGHSPEGPDASWIPVIRCTQGAASSSDDDDDEWGSDDSSDTEDLVMTIYAAPKEGHLISERAVESYKTRYRNEGFEVDDVAYHDRYLNKENRRGLEVTVRTIDESSGYPSREIRRFMFAKDDVLFIVHVDYPYGRDRSGINSDWERIFWGFQLEEEGGLYDE